MTWQGTLLHIFIAQRASMPMEELQKATLIAGVGIEGDRYANGVGYFSSRPHAYRQITLIEMETLEALERDHGIQLLPIQSRRNLVTRDVPLNHLVGRRFRVGKTLLNGGRLNKPCQYLENLLDKPVFTPLLNRAGLNCEIIQGGIVSPADRISPEN
jgi:MOSC domain-containing protein YiiM